MGSGEGFCEVIAGKSSVAFRRSQEQDLPSATRCGCVQPSDTKPRRRLWELWKAQGRQEHHAILFRSAGGETVRPLQTYWHPASEHVIEWFPVAMKWTVVQQQHKAFIAANPEGGAHVAKTVERVTPSLWQGNVDQAFECLGVLRFAREGQRRRCPPAAQLDRGVTAFETYSRNTQKFLPNCGARDRQGDTSSTACVASTLNHVVSTRFVKRQQRQWMPTGAHVRLQPRTTVLDGDLAEVCRGW